MNSEIHILRKASTSGNVKKGIERFTGEGGGVNIMTFNNLITKSLHHYKAITVKYKNTRDSRYKDVASENLRKVWHFVWSNTDCETNVGLFQQMFE